MPDNKKHDEIARFLINVPLFTNLSMRHLKKFAVRFYEARFAKDAVIVEQGKPAIGLYIIEHGSAKVVRKGEDGTDHMIDTLKATDFFGELALLDNEERSATVIALEDTVCLALRKYDFLDELGEEPEIAVEMLREMARRFRRLVEKI